jgi:hypothetical protein
MAGFVRLNHRWSWRIRSIQITRFGAPLVQRVALEWLFIPVWKGSGLWNRVPSERSGRALACGPVAAYRWQHKAIRPNCAD